ncbi:hypothetical protein Q7P35_012375 [Cladosporium inversicolor]
MRITTSTLALLALPALIHAEKVSLIDFIPRVDNVSGGCNKVYQQAVTGCDSQDFKQQSCSAACVKGLASMTKLVKDACSNEGFLNGGNKDSNILALFLQDRGPQNLCGNANEVLQSQSSASAAPTTPAEYSSSTAENTQPSTTAIVSSTSTASSTDVPTSLVMDTSSSPAPTSSTSGTESAESSQSTSSVTSSETSQIFEAPSMPASWTATSASSQSTGSSEHSGGGSPFDVAASQFSSAAATSSSAALLILGLTSTLFAALW